MLQKWIIVIIKNIQVTHEYCIVIQEFVFIIAVDNKSYLAELEYKDLINDLSANQIWKNGS